MKRLFALCVSLLMLMTLACGCGSEEPLSLASNPDNASDLGASQPLSVDVLAGNWTFHMNAVAFAQSNTSESGLAEVGELIEEMNLPNETIHATFTADGKLIYDTQSIETCINDLMSAFRNFMNDKEKVISMMMKAQNKTREELEADASNQGTTLDQLIETRITLLDAMIDRLTQQMPEILAKTENSYYALENGKLYTWSEGSARNENKYMKLHYDGTKIIVTEMNGEEVSVGSVVFTRR